MLYHHYHSTTFERTVIFMISALDLATGVYSTTQPNLTMQGPSSQSNGYEYIVENTNLEDLPLPERPTLPPPGDYPDWESAYYTGFIK